MVYPDPKFSKTKKWPRLEADFFLIPCYHEKHLQQIYCNKIFGRMYGLGVMLTMTTSKLHILIQIVMYVS